MLQRKFQSFCGYHSGCNRVKADAIEWRSVRVSFLQEESNDVIFNETVRNALVLTLDGCERHLTRMDGMNDETPSHPNEVCLIPKGVELHLAWKNHATLQKTLMVEFDSDIFQLYAPELATDQFLEGHLLASNFASRPTMVALMRLVCGEIDEGSRRGRIFADAATRLLAIEIAATAWTRPTKPSEHTAPDPRIHRAVEFIEENYATDISLLEISEAAGLSPTHLTGVFRVQVGTTPYSYVINRRLTHAVHLLRTTRIPIAHVALDSGFADQQHFTRVLRSRYKRTPGQIRREG